MLVPLKRVMVLIAPLGGGANGHASALHTSYKGEGGLLIMARGREKDRKVRKKHRKNIQRMKGLAKSRRLKRGGKK